MVLKDNNRQVRRRRADYSRKPNKWYWVSRVVSQTVSVCSYKTYLPFHNYLFWYSGLSLERKRKKNTSVPE